MHEYYLLRGLKFKACREELLQAVWRHRQVQVEPSRPLYLLPKSKTAHQRARLVCAYVYVVLWFQRSYPIRHIGVFAKPVLRLLIATSSRFASFVGACRYFFNALGKQAGQIPIAMLGHNLQLRPPTQVA